MLLPRSRLVTVGTTLSLLVVVAAAGATIVPGGGKASSDCYAVFDVRNVATPKANTVTCTDGDACDADGTCNVNRKCTFEVRLCVNQPDVGRCTPGDVKRLMGGATLNKPVTPTAERACGEYTTVTVALRRKKTKSARKKIRMTAISGTGRPKKDVDELVLLCKARQGTCTPPAVCGDGIVTSPEACDRSGNAGCTGTDQCRRDCTACVRGTPCNCGTPDPPTQLKFTTGDPSGQGTCGPLNAKVCGGLKDDSGADISGTGNYFNGDFSGLCCGGLYFGGGLDAVPLPAVVPDLGTSLLKVFCSGDGTTLELGPMTVAETGSNRTCTRAGCFFGPPLPIPNVSVGGAATSTCVVNIISADAAGSASCTTGEVANLDMPLASGIYLAGDLLDGSAADRPGIAGIQPCPVCTDGTCKGGPNHGQPCTPGASALGAAYPTSQDCPPPVSQYLASLPIGFELSTTPQSATAVDLTNQANVFCGFCAKVTGIFQGPPAVACASNADCTTAPFLRCQQKNGGAFGTDVDLLKTVRTITETGRVGGGLTDRAAHDATLVSVFCIPPTFNPVVDPSADLPGPGAVALQGTARLCPSAAGDCP